MPVLVFAVVLALSDAARAAGQGAIATEHRLAAAAGAEMLRAGGSAVDAAIAAAAAVCVVHASSCGLGGGGFALVHDAAGDRALDFRECAPAAATAGRFLRDGVADPSRTRSGGLAVAVPGEAAGWSALHAHGGRLPFARLLEPAIRLARDGFPLADAPHLAREIDRHADLLRRDPGLRAVFLAAEDGTAPGDSFRVRQPDLARTLERLGAEGATALYRGPIASAIERAVQERGGVLTAADLARYEPRWRRPLVGRFAGRRIVTFPPPGSGAVVLTVLGLLARDDLPALGHGSATFLHLLAGALAQGFADRARWYGDPDFAPVPLATLLAPGRLHALRAGLRATERVAPVIEAAHDAGTAHVSVVDANGMAVALTTTINTAFGAGVLVPGTGIVLNNEMDDFAAAPEAANVYGLTGAAANAIAPGKRPQSSMSPTVVLDGRRPELVLGGSGGPLIISATVQVLLGAVGFGLEVADAVAAPRVHDQGTPARLLLEPGVPEVSRAALARFGHAIAPAPALGAVAAVGRRADGSFVAAGDRRKDGGALVVD